MKIYLARHGEKVSHSGDSELTETGKLQAQKTGEFLKDKEIAKIFASTYKRTEETAEIIDSILKVGIEFDDRLRERMNWGSIPGQNFVEFIKEWEFSDLNREYQPKAGISAYQSGKNALAVLNEIYTRFSSSNIVVVTHGGVIVDILKNSFDEKILSGFKADFTDKKGKECSITTLNKEANKLEIVNVGSTSHL